MIAILFAAAVMVHAPNGTNITDASGVLCWHRKDGHDYCSGGGIPLPVKIYPPRGHMYTFYDLQSWDSGTDVFHSLDTNKGIVHVLFPDYASCRREGEHIEKSGEGQGVRAVCVPVQKFIP